MVYCMKCGTQNPDDTVNCSKCGAPLNATQTPQQTWEPRHVYRYRRRSGFGGILIGLFIILIGVSALIGWDIWNVIWPLFIIVVGLAIIAGSFMWKRW